MTLDRIAFRSFRRAYDAAVLAPGDAKAHDRFAKWARLVGRIVGLPITGCSETDSAGRDRWVRVTAGVLIAGLSVNYGAGIWLDPSKPQNPAPPRAAITPLMVAATSTGTGASFYVTEMITGKEFRAFPPLPRKPTIKSS